MEKIMVSNGIQEHFKTAEAFFPDSRVYNIVLSVCIQGKLDTVAFFQALKTCCLNIPDVTFESSFTIEECKSKEEAIYKITKLANIRLNPDVPEVLKAQLFRVNNSLHYFCAVQHHTGIDLHAKKLLSRELSAYYNATNTATTFKSYIEEENKDKLEKQLSFWMQYLDNSPEALTLPPAGSSRNFFYGHGSIKKFKEGTQFISGLKAAKDKDLQPFLLLLASYAVLLSELSGQQEFFIGVPFPNRRDPARDLMYGPFVNILPLRVSVKNEETFQDLYNQIRINMLLLHRNQELPFLEIAKLYKGIRDPKIPYFLQAGFTREDPFSLDLNGCEVTPVNIRPTGAQMDLFLTFWESENGIEGRLEYNSSAFSDKQVTEWGDLWQEIVSVAAMNPDQMIGKLPGLTDYRFTSLQQMYKELSRSYPLEKNFRDHLLSSYSKFTDITAIYDDSRRMTFSELGSKVSGLKDLIAKKAGTGKKVLVAMDNSIERLILIHAIVVSGNAYVPVDPNWPVSRVEYIYENSGAVFGIIESRIQDRYTGKPGMLTLGCLKDVPSVKAGSAGAQEQEIIAVLYTSGSTGKPKGVAIPGKGMINRLWWMQEAFPLAPGDALLHKVPFTFDVSMWEIFWPFLFGASLFIPEKGRHLDDVYLSDTIRKKRISYVHFVPSLLRKFLENGGDFCFPDLKGIICSGEALDVSLLKDVFKKTDGIPVHNLYGPTEASIDVTAWTCTAEDLDKEQIPIGYPIANTRIYILDTQRRLCSPWVRGEIAIAGVNLSPGYINNQELTDKAFIHGNWGWGEETIYLTGDIGYYSDDCLIWYSGRKDTQVKINGIRIELAEIERNLEKQQGVNTAVVLIPGKVNGDMTLHAYLGLEAGFDSTVIKTELTRTLPGYMVPEKYHFVTQFPMLSSGKIDRKALASGTFVEEKSQEAATVLAGNINSEIAVAWCEVLNITEVDGNTSFFDLGGHSILLPVLQKKLEALTGKKVSLMDLFRYPTVSAQAALFSGKNQANTSERISSQREQLRRMAVRNRNIRS